MIVLRNSGGCRIYWRGFCNGIARENFGATPTFAEKHAHFRAFSKETSCSICQSLHFLSRSLLRHAEVSHRSWFHSSLPRQGVPVIACHQYFFVLGSAQRGVPWNPRNPPKSATVKELPNIVSHLNVCITSCYMYRRINIVCN